ncbi:hypothetical protein GGF46_003532 [Coemansia sp. RSA 552]|nr:hypothetical protein GGF46_003532 [Coemansia sp. RSA 552]
MSGAAGCGSGGGDIPKIQLESREDVEFLQRQFDEFLERTLASNATLRDDRLNAEQQAEARETVDGQLRQWTQKVWGLASSSMSVNGLAFDEAMQDKARAEPLDESLKHEVEALREEADSLLLSVADKRRTVPGQIERLVHDAQMRESAAAENTTVIRGLPEPHAGDLPFVDGRVNSEFDSAARLAAGMADRAPAVAEDLRRLNKTISDTQKRAVAEAEDDGKVREILLPAKKQQPSDGEHQLLAYKAALHAIGPAED